MKDQRGSQRQRKTNARPVASGGIRSRGWSRRIGLAGGCLGVPLAPLGAGSIFNPYRFRQAGHGAVFRYINSTCLLAIQRSTILDHHQTIFASHRQNLQWQIEDWMAWVL